MLGGHVHFIMLFFGLVAGFVNKNVMIAKLIRSNYYIKRPVEMKTSNKSMTSDLSVIKVNFFNKCLKYSHNKNEKMINKKHLFSKGKERLEHDLCMFNIL